MVLGIVYVTHSTQEVERLANNVVVMKNGVVTAFGHVDEILPALKTATMKEAV